MSEEKKEKKDSFKFLSNWSFLKKIKQVKHIGPIITIIFILILLAILFGDFSFGISKKTSVATETSSTYVSSAQYALDMESKLKNLVSKIKGAGNVEVMVTLEKSAGVVLASNDQTTTNSGTTTVSVTPIMLEQNGQSSPVIIGETLPEIQGVVIVSSGASNTTVRLNILSAVQTLLDLSESQIQILIVE